MGEKDPRGRKAEHGIPKAELAAALGTSTTTLVRAEQHVAAAERYPESAGMTQADALAISKQLDELPADAREQQRASLRQQVPSVGNTPGNKALLSISPTPHLRRQRDPNRRWLQARRGLWVFREKTSDRKALLAMAHCWSRDTLQGYIQDIRQVKDQLIAWERTFEEILSTGEEERHADEEVSRSSTDKRMSNRELWDEAGNGDREGAMASSPGLDSEQTEHSDVSHAAVDTTVPMPSVGAKASAEAACDEGACQVLVERIVATFPAGAPPRRDEVATFVRRLNEEAFPPPHGARTWHMAAMWQRLRSLGYPTSGPL